MTPFPTPRSARNITTRATGVLDKRVPGHINYVAAEHVGFERLPEEVRHIVAKALIGEEIAANAEAPVTKRRADGSHYQVIFGWWASTARLVLIEARRPLESRGAKQFAPCGVWSVATTVHHFAPGVVPERSRWRFDAKTKAVAGTPAPRAIDPLDVLPSPLVAPVRGGSTGAWQNYGYTWGRETIVAMRMGEGRVRVMKAERQAADVSVLTDADWQATTLDAAIVDSLALRGGLLRLAQVTRLT